MPEMKTWGIEVLYDLPAALASQMGVELAAQMKGNESSFPGGGPTVEGQFAYMDLIESGDPEDSLSKVLQDVWRLRSNALETLSEAIGSLPRTLRHIEPVPIEIRITDTEALVKQLAASGNDEGPAGDLVGVGDD